MNNIDLQSLMKSKQFLDSYNGLLPCMDEKTFSKFKSIKKLDRKSFEQLYPKPGAYCTGFFIKERLEENDLQVLLKKHQKELFRFIEKESVEWESSDGFIYYDSHSTFKNKMQFASNLNISLEQPRVEFLVLGRLDEINVYKKRSLYEQY